MTGRGQTVHQISHHLMCDALSETLRQAVRARPSAAEGISSIGCRATAVLYSLLLDHPIDRRGRCRSCRRRHEDALLGIRGCRIHLTAGYWLLFRADKTILLSHLACELGLADARPPRARPPGAGNPRARSLLTVTARGAPHDTDVPPDRPHR
jgi:hypothetical protein